MHRLWFIEKSVSGRKSQYFDDGRNCTFLTQEINLHILKTIQYKYILETQTCAKIHVVSENVIFSHGSVRNVPCRNIKLQVSCFRILNEFKIIGIFNRPYLLK